MKLELEITITSNSNTIETDTLEYFLNIPIFSISAVTDSVNEGGTAQFKVTSNINPGTNPISVKVRPTDTVGDYLKAADGASGDQRTEMLRFQEITLQSGETEYSAMFDVNMRMIDNANTAPGTITVELNPNTEATLEKFYLVAASPNNSASVTIIDQNTPQITIADAPDTVASVNAEFPLTATFQPYQPVTIRYIISETGSNFLDTSNGAVLDEDQTQSIRFIKQPDGSGKGTLPISTIVDSANPVGTISVQLLADSTATNPSYTITGDATSNTKLAAIFAYPIRTISIEQSSITIDEGESTNITIIADGNPERNDFPLKYTPTETSMNTTFLQDDSDDNGTGISRTDILDFVENETTGKWEAEITIATKPVDDNDTDHGVILVTLDNPGNNSYYQIEGDPNDRVTIHVNELKKPVIKIADGAAVTNFLGTGPRRGRIPQASFPITSSFSPFGNSINVSYRLTETGGNFLNPIITGSVIRNENITFANNCSNCMGNLIFDLKDEDRDNSEQSTITVTLLADPLNYTLSDIESEQTGAVTVNDPSYAEVNGFHGNNFPELTLKDNGGGPGNDWQIKDVTLFIKDSPASYSIGHRTRVINYEEDNYSYNAEWYLDDSTSISDLGSGGNSRFRCANWNAINSLW